MACDGSVLLAITASAIALAMLRLPALVCRLVPAAALLIAIAGCVRPPEPVAPPPQPPRAAPVPRPAPALPEDWRDWPLTPGTWTYGRDAGGTRALFGVSGTDAALVLRCDAAQRRMILSRRGTNAGSVTIRTSSTMRSLPVTPTGTTPHHVAATLAVRDPLLDAMAFSRGRFVVEQAGQAPLVIPTYAEIGRVIEDCRG